MSISGQVVSRMVGAQASDGKRWGRQAWAGAMLRLTYDPADPFAIKFEVDSGPWPMPEPYLISREMVMDVMRDRAHAWVGHDTYWVRSTRAGAVEFAFGSMQWRVRPIAWQFSAFIHATVRSVRPGDEQMLGLDAFIEGLLS